jgi:hypothetical protein
MKEKPISPLTACPFCKVRLDPDWTYCDNMYCKSKFVQTIMGSGKETVYRWGFHIGAYSLVCQFCPEGEQSKNSFSRNYFEVYSLVGPNYSPIFHSDDVFIPDFSDLAKLKEKIDIILTFS